MVKILGIKISMRNIGLAILLGTHVFMLFNQFVSMTIPLPINQQVSHAVLNLIAFYLILIGGKR